MDDGFISHRFVRSAVTAVYFGDSSRSLPQVGSNAYFRKVAYCYDAFVKATAMALAVFITPAKDFLEGGRRRNIKP